MAHPEVTNCNVTQASACVKRDLSVSPCLARYLDRTVGESFDERFDERLQETLIVYRAATTRMISTIEIKCVRS